MKRITLITLFVAVLYLPHTVARASSTSSILPPVSLQVGLDDLDTLTFYFHESSFSSFSNAAELKSNGEQLISANKSIPLKSAKLLLNSLQNMYPSPEALTLLRWTDDYPYEQITIKLTDGRQIVAISTSQFPKAIPWNIRVWQGDPNKGGELIGSYILLNYQFHEGANEIWSELTGEPFPRNYELDQFYWSEEDKQPTIEFYVPDSFDSFQSSGNEISVDKKEPDAILQPFSSVLKANSELSSLFARGYTLFDAAFNTTVDVNSLTPIQYSGMIALRAPDSPDVIVSTASISDTNRISVQTPLTLNAVEAAIAKRKNFKSLQRLTEFLPGVVFIHDLRATTPSDFIELSCAENPQYAKQDYRAELLLTANNNQKIIFHHLPEKSAWTVDGYFAREERTWNDQIMQRILQTWFPSPFTQLKPETLENLDLNLGIAFQPNITQQETELLTRLKKDLPPQSSTHFAHPQKDGDKSFVRLEGRLIIPEDNSAPQIIYCGHERPSWQGPSYKVSEVKRPDPSADRFNLRPALSRQEGWTVSYGLPDGNTEVDWTAFTSSAPGYMHLLWTIHKKGVFYSEGWADGTGWLKPQRLGDESWSLQAVSNSNGEVHLIWSTDYDPVGSMHVWRSSDGEWQKPEYWEGIGYFSDILLDKDGNLHMTWSQSDGWDEEFFYSTWDRQTGISEPENISRRLGDIGNNSIILKIDTTEKLHVAWGHPLSNQQYIDPLSGEAFDTSGVFYSTRLGKDYWTLPEQIGVFAPFSNKMDFELLEDSTPLIIWQSPDGITTSMAQDNKWTAPTVLQTITPPETPDPFGPGRWVTATTEINLQNDSRGQLYAIWLDPLSGLNLSTLDKNSWSTPKQILSGEGLSRLETQIGPDDSLHAIYFDVNGSLKHLKHLNNENTETSMGMGYDGYGVDVANMEIDTTGFVYVLGLPRRPHWKVFLPQEGISLIPTPVPSATFTHQPNTTSTPQPSVTETPLITSTSTPEGALDIANQPSIGSIEIYTLFFVIALFILGISNRYRKQ